MKKKEKLKALFRQFYPVRTPPTPVGGEYGNKPMGVNAPIGRPRSARSNGVYLGSLTKRFRPAAFMHFLVRRERIGGLLIREESAELALFEKIINPESTKEETRLLLKKEMSLSPGTIIEGRIARPDNLRQALKELKEEAAKISLESVVLSISSGLMQTMSFSYPLHLSRDQVKEALDLAAESSFPVSPALLYFDWVITSDQRAEHQEAMVSMALRQDIDPYVDIVVEAGFSPIAVETHSMSIARMFSETVKDRLMLIVEPTEVVGVVFAHGLIHLQIQYPVSILEEHLEDNEKNPLEIIAGLALRLVHSAASGEEQFELKDVIVVSQGLDLKNFSLIFKQKKLPPLVDCSETALPPGISFGDCWMSGSLGAATRGLIPRKFDTMASLMAIGTEQAYERARFFSFADFLQKFTISFGGFLTLVFAGAFIFINALAGNIDESFEKEPPFPVEYVKIHEAAGIFNENVRQIFSLEQKMPRWENLFKEIDATAVTGISYKKLEVLNAGSIIMEGTAKNRDALLLLKATLENSSVFGYEPLPLPLFLQKENIDFTLKLTLKDPKKIFP